MRLSSIVSKSNFKRIATIITLSLFIELFICNGKSFLSFLHKDISVNLANFEYNTSGLAKSDNDTFIVTQKDNCFIEYNNINLPVYSLFVNAFTPSREYIGMNLYISDEGYTDYYKLPWSDSMTIVTTSPDSFWYKLEPFGNVINMKIVFDASNMLIGDEIHINQLSLNVPRPMHFSYIRFILLLLITSFIAYFTKYRNLFSIKILGNQKKYALISLCIIIFQASTIIVTADIYAHYCNVNEWPADRQYQELSQSLAQGKVSLINENPPKYLNQLKNIYDPIERNKMSDLCEEPYLFDVAYHNGKYYVYFGIGPVILFYLPYYLITGNNLANHIPIILCGIIYCIMSYLFLIELSKKWFQNIRFITFSIIQFAFPFCSGWIYLTREAWLYSVPIATGMCLVISGLTLLMYSAQNPENIRSIPLIAGSACMAAAVACRPTLLMMSILCLFIILPTLITSLKKNCQSVLLPTVCLIIPYLVIGILLMIYNYIRFDSIFDFGFAYQLTSRDFTKEGFRLGKLGLAVFEEIFRPIDIVPSFPFLHMLDIQTSYMGPMYAEAHSGGALAICPIFMSLFALVPLRNSKLGNSKAYNFSILCIFLALTYAALAGALSGIAGRYCADYYYLFAIATFCVIAMIENYVLSTFPDNHKAHYYFIIISLLLSASTVILMLLSFFISDHHSAAETFPFIFYKIKYIFEFWN